MRSFRLLFTVLIASTILLSSCSKGDKGDPGPQGAPGAPGNANVLTINFTVTPSQWSAIDPNLNPGDEGYFLYYLLNIVEINQEIIDYGAVIAYYDDGGFYLPLPFTKYLKTTVPNAYLWEETLDMVLSTGTCQINFKSNDFFIPEGSSQSINIRLVIIDGLAREQNPNLDWSNYTLVKEKFNLEE
jgi:hypothetical protein